tara:strand:- start:638 stop:1276 length:639 start_codon:yes stop_codon:yes gene_type:complete
MSFGAMLANAAEQERNRRANQSQFDRSMDLAENQFKLNKTYTDYAFNKGKKQDESLMNLINIMQTNRRDIEQNQKNREQYKNETPTFFEGLFDLFRPDEIVDPEYRSNQIGSIREGTYNYEDAPKIANPNKTNAWGTYWNRKPVDEVYPEIEVPSFEDPSLFQGVGPEGYLTMKSLIDAYSNQEKGFSDEALLDYINKNFKGGINYLNKAGQ